MLSLSCSLAGRQLLDSNDDSDFVSKGKDTDDHGGHWDPSRPSHGPPPGWIPPPVKPPPPGWHPESPRGGPQGDDNGYQRWVGPGQGSGQGQGQTSPGSNGGSFPGNMVRPECLPCCCCDSCAPLPLAHVQQGGFWPTCVAL